MLVLRLVDVDPARHAAPVEFTCDRHGATLGRGAHVDWVLPDAERRVSSVHAVIQFTGGRYVLEDRSTNGTFLGTAQDRLPGPHELRDGDALRIGPYTVGVQLLGAAPPPAGAAAAGGAGAASPNDAWGALAKDYDETAPEISERAWGRKPQRAVLDTPEDIAQGSFVAPPPKPTAQPGGTDVWANLAKTFDDGWGQTSAPAPTTNERPDPVTKPGAAAPAWRDAPASAPAPAAASNANPWADEAGGASSAPSAPSAQPTSAAPPPAAPTSGDLAALAQGLGLAPDALS